MFSGIIQQLGTIRIPPQDSSKDSPKVVEVKILCDVSRWDGRRQGESVAVDGACLTATSWDNEGFYADISEETRRVVKPFIKPAEPVSPEHSSSSERAPEAMVNLERSLAYGQLVGGHLISGHVEGTARVIQPLPDDDNDEGTGGSNSGIMAFSVPEELMPCIISKGCIAINGVSLTVNRIWQNNFDVTLIPHSVQNTNLGWLRAGDLVNIETDLMARYVLRSSRGISTL